MNWKCLRWAQEKCQGTSLRYSTIDWDDFEEFGSVYFHSITNGMRNQLIALEINRDLKRPYFTGPAGLRARLVRSVKGWARRSGYNDCKSPPMAKKVQWLSEATVTWDSADSCCKSIKSRAGIAPYVPRLSCEEDAFWGMYVIPPKVEWLSCEASFLSAASTDDER